MFEIRANMKFGIDDTYDCEYNGVVYETKEEAEKALALAEIKEADNDDIIYLYVEEV